MTMMVSHQPIYTLSTLLFLTLNLSPTLVFDKRRSSITEAFIIPTYTTAPPFRHDHHHQHSLFTSLAKASTHPSSTSFVNRRSKDNLIFASSSSMNEERKQQSEEGIDIETLTEEDWESINTLSLKANEKDKNSITDNSEAWVTEILSKTHPRVTVALQRQQLPQQSELEKEYNISAERASTFIAASKFVTSTLTFKLTAGRDLLAKLLKSGEIRNLDAEIGNSLRAGKLDVAFMNVLTENIRDATEEEMLMDDDTKEEEGSTDGEGGANRLQILQHIYTRCVEEIEKSIPPSTAVLNKLLRTDSESIRSNQIRHYLCPPPQESNSITTPDGKVIELASSGAPKSLVPPSEFVDALSSAVSQIRTLERAKGTDRATAANLIESLRSIAIEVRIAFGETYGMESDQLNDFEDCLQPVFRPDSEESRYITGD